MLKIKKMVSFNYVYVNSKKGTLVKRAPFFKLEVYIRYFTLSIYYN